MRLFTFYRTKSNKSLKINEVLTEESDICGQNNRNGLKAADKTA